MTTVGGIAGQRSGEVSCESQVAFITTSKTKAVEDQKERTLRQGIMESRAFIPVLKHIKGPYNRHEHLCSALSLPPFLKQQQARKQGLNWAARGILTNRGLDTWVSISLLEGREGGYVRDLGTVPLVQLALTSNVF